MQETALPLHDSGASVSTGDLEGYARSWIIVGQIGQLSKATLASRKLILEELIWFLGQREHSDPDERSAVFTGDRGISPPGNR